MREERLRGPQITRPESRRGLACAAALLALHLIAAGGATAQESFPDLGGTWWFRVDGQDAGALLIAFSDAHTGDIEVQDTLLGQASFGYSRTLGAFFVVPPGQVLGLDSKGNVVGTLQLEDPSTDAPVGTLTLERGKPNKKFTGWKLRASIEGSGVAAATSKLKGQRLPETFPVLSGSNPRTHLSGEGVKSKAFDLHVVSDPVLGLPAYGFDGEGPARIDGVEVPSTTLSGAFMLAPNHWLFGELEESSDFGTGHVKGKLKLPSGSLVPKLKLIARADRKFAAKAKLTEPAEPVLAVSPTRVDFGALHLGAGQETTFEVTNVGAGSLSGEASFLDGSSEDFQLVSGEAYLDLEPGDAAHGVTLRFAPGSPGAKTEEILFDVGGGRVGAQIVTVTGEGGIAEIGVVPSEIAFGPTPIGVSASEIVTVTNTGDGILEGSAVIAGAPDFALALTAVGLPLARIDYELAPNEELVFFVRFRPSAAGLQSATLTLTGGGGASVPLTGGSAE